MLILIITSYNYIILPFKSTNISINLINTLTTPIENILSEINKNQLYSLVSFGNPPKNLEFYFTMKKSYYAILSNFCKNGTSTSYNPFFSTNFTNKTNIPLIEFDILNNGKIGFDKCSVYIDLNLTKIKNIDSFEYILGNYSFSKYRNLDSDKYCGMIGLVKDPNESFLFAQNFICYLKLRKLINSYAWGIFFFDKENSYNIDYDIQKQYDGFYIGGIPLDNYSEIFRAVNITNIYSKKTNNYIEFDKIYFYENNSKKKNEYLVSKNTTIELVIDNNYIISEFEYYNKIKELFFKKYLDNDICIEKSSQSEKYKKYIIICDLSFEDNLKNFPTLFLYSRQLSFTFNLDYNDVFYIDNNKIYFLIVGSEIKESWILGKMFMKKYPFIFDQDKKSIYFIHLNKYKDQSNNNGPKENENNINIWKNVFLFSSIFLLFIGIIIGIFIGGKIWKKHRKKKANELNDEDNYEYISKEDAYTKINE